jgi:hypothetical protein
VKEEATRQGGDREDIDVASVSAWTADAIKVRQELQITRF